MARPNLRDGWFKLAYELLPALLFAGLRLEAAIVLCEVLAQTYGRGKHATAQLSPTKIAARCSRKPQNISRGIRDLVEARVIRKADDGGHAFVKDYEQWRGRDGNPLIDPAMAQYLAAYPILARLYDPNRPSDEIVSTVDTKSEDADGSVVSTCDTKSVSTVDTKVVSTCDTKPASPSALPLVGVRLSESIGEHTQEACVCVEDRDGNRTPFRGDLEPDPAELRRVSEKAERLFPMLAFDLKVGQFATSYPLAWIDLALEQAAASGKRIGWAYVYAILKRWLADGGPPAPSASGRGQADAGAAPGRKSDEELKRLNAEATARIKARMEARANGRL